MPLNYVGSDQRDLDEEFRVYVAEQSARLVRLTRVLLGAGHAVDAEDVVQDGLVSVYRKWSRIQRNGPARDAYIYRTLVRGARRHLARLGARDEVSLDHLSTAQSQARSDYDALEDAERIRKALADLAPRQREAVVLHYLLDQPIDVTARLMGTSTGTVKSQLFKARERLSDLLVLRREC